MPGWPCDKNLHHSACRSIICFPTWMGAKSWKCANTAILPGVRRTGMQQWTFQTVGTNYGHDDKGCSPFVLFVLRCHWKYNLNDEAVALISEKRFHSRKQATFLASIESALHAWVVLVLLAYVFSNINRRWTDSCPFLLLRFCPFMMCLPNWNYWANKFCLLRWWSIIVELSPVIRLSSPYKSRDRPNFGAGFATL